jgi:hypothetical protein
VPRTNRLDFGEDPDVFVDPGSRIGPESRICLSDPSYLKKLRTNFDETFRDDWSRAKDQSIRFWGRSGCLCGSRIILKVSLPVRDRAKSRTAQLGGGDALYGVPSSS